MDHKSPQLFCDLFLLSTVLWIAREKHQDPHVFQLCSEDRFQWPWRFVGTSVGLQPSPQHTCRLLGKVLPWGKAPKTQAGWGKLEPSRRQVMLPHPLTASNRSQLNPASSKHDHQGKLEELLQVVLRCQIALSWGYTNQAQPLKCCPAQPSETTTVLPVRQTVIQHVRLRTATHL